MIIEIVLKLFFLPIAMQISKFSEIKLTPRSYIISEVMLTNQKIQFINKKEFIKVLLNKNIKVYII